MAATKAFSQSIKLNVARFVFQGVEFSQVFIDGRPGYRAQIGTIDLQEFGLTNLCQKLWNTVIAMLKVNHG